MTTQKGDLYIKLLSTLSWVVRVLFRNWSQLNVLCRSAVKLHYMYIEYNNLLFTCPVCTKVYWSRKLSWVPNFPQTSVQLGSFAAKKLLSNDPRRWLSGARYDTLLHLSSHHAIKRAPDRLLKEWCMTVLEYTMDMVNSCWPTDVCRLWILRGNVYNNWTSWLN